MGLELRAVLDYTVREKGDCSKARKRTELAQRLYYRKAPFCDRSARDGFLRPLLRWWMF
jgi:hypothetical protein